MLTINCTTECYLSARAKSMTRTEPHAVVLSGASAKRGRIAFLPRRSARNILAAPRAMRCAYRASVFANWRYSGAGASLSGSSPDRCGASLKLLIAAAEVLLWL